MMRMLLAGIEIEVERVEGREIDVSRVVRVIRGEYPVAGAAPSQMRCVAARANGWWELKRWLSAWTQWWSSALSYPASSTPLYILASADDD
jgi:hypothetical protein